MKVPVLTSFIIALALLASISFYVTKYQIPHDKTIRLPQGYYLGNVDTAPVLLLGPASSKKKQIGPSVDGYLVLPGSIVGHVSDNKNNEAVPGYFIIDLVTGKVDEGLSKQVWTEKLGEYEITVDVKLWKPSRQDERLGRNKPQVQW